VGREGFEPPDQGIMSRSGHSNSKELQEDKSSERGKLEQNPQTIRKQNPRAKRNPDPGDR
jgi:hypothetical protein